MRRLFRTGTGKGQVLGTAQINFYATEERTVDACSVHWDSDPSFIALLPSVSFDEWLPNLRSLQVQTAAGPGELIGSDAQEYALGQFEDWLDDGRLSTAGELPTFEALPLVLERDDRIVAGASMVVRINHGKRRLWSETDHEPDDAGDIVFTIARKVLWDWAIAGAAVTVDPDELVNQMRRQCEHYRQHGIPSSFMLRELGTAPYAVWQDHPTVRLGA